MARSHRLRGLAAALLLTLCAAPAIAIPVPPDPMGTQLVGHAEMDVIDASRDDRKLALDIWYPADPSAWAAEPKFTFFSLISVIGMTSDTSKDDLPLPEGETYPLIVFSHGYGGVNYQSFRLMEHLASHGFVVVAPEHTGNLQGDMSSPDPEADRYPDIAFVIDEMAAESGDPSSRFFEHIDAGNVGVAGHSFGGMTALFMAAGHDPYPPDARVKVIMPIAPSSSRLTDAELESITLPCLLLVGTEDSLQAETIRSFGLISSAPDLFRVDVIGATHTHFANVCDIGNALIDSGIPMGAWATFGAEALIGPYTETCIPPAFPVDEAIRIQNLYAAALFRTVLLGDEEYRYYLDSAYAVANEPDVEFFQAVPEPAAPLLHLTALVCLATLGRSRRMPRGRLQTASWFDPCSRIANRHTRARCR